MDCPSCYREPAIHHSQFGILPGDICRNRHNQLLVPQDSVEVVPDRIKEERQERQDSIEQPHFKHELNKKWVDLWGEDAAKERGFTDKEIKNAKYVMDEVKGVRYYKDRS